MPLSIFNQLKISRNPEKPVAQLKSYSGHLIDVEEIVTLPCVHKGKQYAVKFHIVNREVPAVLSASTCTEMGLIQRIHAIDSNNTQPLQSINNSSRNETMPNVANTDQSVKSEIIKEYPELFKGLGCLPGEHDIKINTTVSPVVHPPRKVPITIKNRIIEELDRMEAAGVIVRQIEPTEWVSSMVMVIKPNKVRICLDPRDLNVAIKREHFPMKIIEEIVAEIPGARVFSTLDAKSGFWQMKLTEESSKLCTFNTLFGRYRLTRLPFGIKSAPEIFQKSMSRLFEDIEGAEVIVDDRTSRSMMRGSSRF